MADFDLHEDDWGMVSLLPAENTALYTSTAEDARAFGAAHWDGAGWTDIFLLPDPDPDRLLFRRGIRVEWLQELAAPDYLPAERVLSGYSTQREEVQSGFAFGVAHGGRGALYGSHTEGVVRDLNVLLPWTDDVRRRFVDLLVRIGTEHNLVLANWWRAEVIELNEAGSVLRSLTADDED